MRPSSPPTRLASTLGLLLCALSSPLHAQARDATPLRQSDLTAETATARPLTLRDASRNDRWLGLGVRDVRWAPDGSAVYFRWNRRPAPDDLPDADPWFRADPDGRWVEELGRDGDVPAPGADVSWSDGGDRAAWAREGGVFLYDVGRRPATRRILTLERPPRTARMTGDGSAVHVEVGEALHRYAVDDGTMTAVAVRLTRSPRRATEAADWLAAQQRDLFAHIRRRDAADRAAAALSLARRGDRPQALPVDPDERIDAIRLSPDGRFVTFRARRPAADRPATTYVDYVDESGYATVREARAKVGEPRDVVRLGIVARDPSVPDDSVPVTWVSLPEAGDRATVPHGPYWSRDGGRAVVQFVGEDHQDLWIVELDVGTGATRVLAHDRDDAWIGGPPIQANYLQPALLEWLPDGSFVFASERSGWSHLHRVEPSGTVTPLTQGRWEVRNAALSRDRRTWLLQGSREGPADDHLYLMPAAGGPLVRLTEVPGRHEGWLSPDGRRLAVVSSESVRLPDLFVRRAAPGDEGRRVTVSGNDAFHEHPLARPEIVSFPHPDGEPVWAAVFSPQRPNPERAAVIHVHGGGYRQFAHRGWSVYGYALHLGFVNYLVQEGYTVLDFDYRGSAGFGRDYRTDIARAMGIKDTDGVAAAARYLADEAGVDPERIGIYGVSYGGFLTLMAQFRYPGVFAAGIARAAVTDWAHYSDGWTSRILGVPHMDAEAYRRSSPIYYAEGLEDNLLITHGLVDDNVHFQDAARLVQRLIELEKSFEVMYYPVEPHTIQTEASRYDYVRRAVGFFDRHLRGR